jgi:DNA (cytosine-5)-methyltransferase 1
MRLRGLSMFASGGIGETYIDDIGNIEIKVANELEKNRAKFYSHFHKDVTMIQGDITDVNVFDKVLKESIDKKVNFIMSTPPCQGFSKAGKQDDNDARNILIKYVMDMINKIKPEYALIENVPEFVKSYFILNDIKINSLEYIQEQIGRDYTFIYDIIDGQYFDTPQVRKRCFFLITKKGNKEWTFPKKVTTEPVTVEKAIGHLPSLESGQKSDNKYHYAKEHNQNHILWMRHTPSGKSAFDNEEYYPSKDGRRIKGFKTTYKRISWDKPSPTITMMNGNISSQNNVHPGRKYIENGEVLYSDARVLSILEIMILSGLPEDWDIPEWVSETLIRHLIGECVLPKVIFYLLKQLQ